LILASFHPHIPHPLSITLFHSPAFLLPMQYENAGELPEWVKLVNRLLHGQETLEDVMPSRRANE